MQSLEGRGRIVDEVYEHIREAILSGELKPETSLTVQELADRLNVSRTPVREAVRLLVTEGLATEEARRGCFVAKVHLRDLLDIHDMRAVLEALAVERSNAATKTHIADLTAQIDRQKQALATENWREFTAADRSFHEVFHALAGNERLTNTLKRLRGQMEIALVEVALSTELMQQSIAEHTAIVDAVRQSDPDAASNMMRAHIMATRKRVHTRLEERAAETRN
ncbi:GntR family transcriptional regulator [Marinibacterium sp. SX1]|uniref:GntR family transcriptional regulator n=1 Tax=Marinibacterium sp. SX1 TaxID=3388424 RepID=UPI003D17C158